MEEQLKAIDQEVSSSQPKPLYIFHGNEPYYIDLLCDAIADKLLPPELRDFNQSVFYAEDSKAESIVNLYRQYPVMASHQVIVLKEMQSWRSTEINKLLPLAQHPVSTTVVVLCMKGAKLDKRSAFYKAAQKVACIVESEALYESEIVPWINHYAAQHGLSIDARACDMLAMHVGSSLEFLVQALEKLAFMAKEGERIGAEAVGRYIGVSKDFNVFELTGALARGQFAKAVRIAQHFATNQKNHNIILTVTMVYRFFRQLAVYHQYPDKSDRKGLMPAVGASWYGLENEVIPAARVFSFPKVAQALEILHDIDLKAKGINSHNSDGGELTKELVGRLIRLN